MAVEPFERRPGLTLVEAAYALIGTTKVPLVEPEIGVEDSGEGLGVYERVGPQCTIFAMYRG